MRSIDTRHGELAIPVVDQDVICRFLEVHGEWAWLETSIAAAMFASPLRVLDVGAFIGTFTLGLARQAEVVSACCVEADAEVAVLLAHNLDTNLQVPHATVAKAVLPPGIGAAVGHSQAGNLGTLSFADNAEGEVRLHLDAIDITTLSELFQDHGPFDLVKLDVEGLELQLLAEAGTPKNEAAFWIECNESPASVQIAELVLGWGRSVDFVSWPAANPDNLRGSTDPIFPFAHEAALVVGALGPFELSLELRALGCRHRSIETYEQLRLALWSTPRWGPAHWQGLDELELVAVAGHELLKHRLEEYLRPGSTPDSNRDGWPIALSDDAGPVRRTELAECLVSLEQEWRRAESAEAELVQLHARYLDAIAQHGSIE